MCFFRLKNNVSQRKKLHNPQTRVMYFSARIFTLILVWSTKNKMLSFKWKLDVLYRSNLLQFTSIYNFSFSHGNNSLGLMNGALLNRRGPPFLINLKIRHPSRKHVNSISEMCNSGWKYTYSRFKINQAYKDGGQIMRT